MAVVEALGIDAELHAQQDKIADLWEAHPSIKQLLEDHYPGEWRQIERCRQSWMVKERQNSREYRIAPRRSCHRLPYCLVCVRSEEWRRAFKLLDVMPQCTPRGERMAGIHVVQTAPLTEDGKGWGAVARRNHKAFGRIVARSLEDIYEGSVGTVLAYQDFGERPFIKPHPHMDGILNGWVVREGRAAKTPRIELKGGSDERWHEAIIQRAQAFQLGAQRGSFSVSNRIESERALLKVARYSLREMVNFRQVEYDRATQRVEWLDYKSKNRQEYKVHEWKAGLAEYQYRLGQGVDGKRHPLHARYGDFHSRSLRTTQTAMDGATRKHEEACPCGRCQEWSELSWEKVDELVRQAGGRGAEPPLIMPRSP